MPLANYKAETRTHMLGDEPVVVQGLTLKHITQLVQMHLPDLEAIYQIGSEVMDGRQEFTSDEIALVATAVTNQAPGFVANCIAIAANEGDKPEAIEAASNLPFGLQLAIMTDIIELTLTEIGSVKKVVGLLKVKLAGTKIANKIFPTAAR